MEDRGDGGHLVGETVVTLVLAMGNNADGQLGTGISEDGDDRVWEPCPLPMFERAGVVAAAVSLKHSAWLTRDGVVYTAGDNDEGQLGRSGKRSRPLKVDAIEHLPIDDISAGDSFTVMAARLDGRLLGVGRGDRGQLGMGGADREHKEKVKFSSALGDEQLMALSAGEAHCAALCRSGRVLAFGENKHGQLGFGDFVSSATPKPVAALYSRPVVRLCCGASHTLARTASGLLWAWGLNEHGQLGLGDFKTRYRPEQVKALRVSRCTDVVAGSRHTLSLSEKGLVFACGAGGSGQLGSGGIAEAEPTFRVVDALREVGRSLMVACGHSHSMALVQNEDSLREYIYCWGLGSSGQLGLPRSSLQDGKMALLPQRLRLDPGYRVVDIVSGPLAHHTFLLLALVESASNRDEAVGLSTDPSKPPLHLQSVAAERGAVAATAYPTRHSLRTAIDADELLRTLRRITVDGQANDPQLKALVKAVGSAFSSASVLNASFRSHDARSLALSEEASGVDLLKVRKAYHTLIFEIRSSDLIVTLGKATLSICGELATKRVPTDDPENLCVFLVLFENPLLLAEHRTSLFPGFHRALQQLVAAVLSLPKDSQRLLFGWLKRLPSEYFGRAVEVVQQFVSFILTQPGQNRSDASAAVLMLRTLWDMNKEMDGILPEWCFHNAAISQSSDLEEHYRQWIHEEQNSHVFSYCKYPFLLDAEAKRRLLSFDAKVQMESAMQELVAQTWRQGLPVEATFEQLLQFRVRREHLLSDFCGQLWWRLQHMPRCLRLPLAVEFVGELGVDAGGLRKECLQLVLRQLLERTSLFAALEDLPGLVWFRPLADCWDGKRGKPEERPLEEAHATSELELHSAEWVDHLPEIVGTVVGLAAFNGIYLDLRLHPLIYRFLISRSVSASLDDLRAVHPTLHRSLSSLRGARDVGALALTWTVRLPGADVDFDLAKGSPKNPEDEDRPVEAGEVEQFVSAYAKAALTTVIQSRLDTFVRHALGCMAVGKAFDLLSAHDLELLLCGSPDLGKFEELQRGCKYANGFTAESPTVCFFWEVMHALPEATKRKLLLFCTGCDRVPIVGLKALGFVIARSSAGTDHLPTANTCVNQLNLPAYDSVALTRERLLAALEHHAGFGFA